MDLEKLRICVHCGLCLQACPTYQLNQNEADSPRGRIALMRGMAEGRIQATETALEHLDGCLDCRACETACPAGVPYGELIEQGRGELYPQVKSFSRKRRLLRFFLARILASRGKLNFLSSVLRFYQKSGLRFLARKSGILNLLPAHLKEGESLLPDLPPLILRTVARPPQKPKARAAFFKGCIAPILFPGVERSAVEVLENLGASVDLPARQVCCGALLLHGGLPHEARKLAAKNLQAFADSYDFVVVTAAGCGSTLKEYSKLLPDSPEAARFSAKVLDFSQAVLRLGLEVELKPFQMTVAYQDACHLVHAQRIRTEPREIMKSIPGLKLVELSHADRCCGSAGIYNLTHPDNARELLEEKVREILSVNPDVVAVANPGCSMQIRMGLRKSGSNIPVLHPAEILRASLSPLPNSPFS